MYVMYKQDPHITLIGDHKQLQSVTLCHAAAKLGLRKSLFERLEHLAERLDVQYRMVITTCLCSYIRYKTEVFTG